MNKEMIMEERRIGFRDGVLVGTILCMSLLGVIALATLTILR